jgi:GH43 family beta-xylosidase
MTLKIGHLIFLVLLISSCRTEPPPPTLQAKTELFSNPLLDSGADPWIIRDDSVFHYCFSRGGSLWVETVSAITDLTRDGATKVWTPPAEGMYSKELWAPELHKIGEKWYIYFAADDGDNHNHRMYALQSKGATVESGFEFAGQIKAPSDKWAIDGTTLHYGNKSYFIWSGWEGDVNEAQHLYIAEMSSPLEISSERVRISSPDYEWEQRGSGNGLPTINEGPQILERDGEIFIIYSAAGSWSDHYCLGMLKLTGKDPMQPEAWEKSAEPVFAGTDCVISPGHCSFVKIGQQDWIVYHSNKVRGGGWNSRYVKMQPVHWNEYGPLLGTPVQDGVILEITY